MCSQNAKHFAIPTLLICITLDDLFHDKILNGNIHFEAKKNTIRILIAQILRQIKGYHYFLFDKIFC